MSDAERPVAVVVDDSDILREFIALVLQDAGYHVLKASNGEGALTMFQLVGPSVALLWSDIDMPGDLDGVDLAEAIGRRWLQVAIVLNSSRDVPNDRLPERATFLRKPLTPSRIFAHLCDVVDEVNKPAPLRMRCLDTQNAGGLEHHSK